MERYWIDEQMRQSYTDWIMAEGEQIGLDAEVVKAYELANPLGMGADGVLWYWKKVKMAKDVSHPIWRKASFYS